VYYLRDRIGLSHDQVNRLIGLGVLVTTVVIMVGSNVFRGSRTEQNGNVWVPKTVSPHTA
jgi:hypothetical protein